MAGITRAEAEDFLYFEAQLLDERRLEEWLELFTEDGIYWLPIDAASEPKRHLSLVYDDALRRRERVWRLLHTEAPSQFPASRTQHFVSNLRVEPGANGEAIVRSAQMVCEMRGGDYRQMGLGGQQNFACSAEHRLLRRNGSWRIALKKLVLLNRDVPIENLSFLL